jgi:hypothetical protein
VFNNKSMQMLKSTVWVDISDGAAFAQDDHLREIAEGNVSYVPEADKWMPRVVSGATVRCAMPSHLAVAVSRKSGRWSR